MSRQDYGDYRGDVFYETWRAGRNPDHVDDDRVSDLYYSGYSSEEAARSEIRRIDDSVRRRCEEEAAQEEEYYRMVREHEEEMVREYEMYCARINQISAGLAIAFKNRNHTPSGAGRGGEG